jgi:hypothetical protein
MDLGHWNYSETLPNNSYGFIYEIVNTTTGRKYIGKKQIVRKVKRPPLKGRKNKRCILKESDWKTYTGSCRELNEDIQALGKENFAFTILKICYNKWELAYEETKLQIQSEVLLSDKYYNGIINCRIGKKPKNVNPTYT